MALVPELAQLFRLVPETPQAVLEGASGLGVERTHAGALACPHRQFRREKFLDGVQPVRFEVVAGQVDDAESAAAQLRLDDVVPKHRAGRQGVQGLGDAFRRHPVRFPCGGDGRIIRPTGNSADADTEFRQFPGKLTRFADTPPAWGGLPYPLDTHDGATTADGNAAGHPGPTHEAHAGPPPRGAGSARASPRRMDRSVGRLRPARAAHRVHRRAARNASRICAGLRKVPIRIR